jgi:hypothetical protein
MERRITVLVVLLIIFSMNIFGINISIEKREVLAVDELHITSSKPDIIKVDNGLFMIEILPNRGRIIWNLYPVNDVSKKFVYSSEDPYLLPFFDEITSQYFFELGGFYLSEPWNPRSNQPYPYEKYEILQKNNEVHIVLEGMNPTEKIHSKVVLIIKDSNPKILINVTLQNLSENPVNISLKEFTVFELSYGNLITDYPEISQKTLKDFPEYKLFKVDDLKFFGAMKEKHSLKKIFEEGYSNHYIQTWGENWEEEIGSAPAFRLVDERNKITLNPYEKHNFQILFEYEFLAE